MNETAETEGRALQLPSTDPAGSVTAPGSAVFATSQTAAGPSQSSGAGPDDFLLGSSLVLLIALAAAILAILRLRERLRRARLDSVRAGEDAEQARKLVAQAEEITEGRVKHRTARLVERCQQLERERDELERVNAVLKGMVKNDTLTGLANGSYFERRLDSELRRARRTANVLSVIVCDVDRFHQYNRAGGHDRGDLLLRRLGRLLSRSFRRGGEVVARLGADRFAVLVPDADAAHALSCAENLLQTTRSEGLAARGAGENVTISIGLVCLAPGDTPRVHEILEEAVATLALAKAAGGDRLQVAASDRVFRLRGAGGGEVGKEGEQSLPEGDHGHGGQR